MTSTTYFGRPEPGDRSLGSDFNLIAKWAKSFTNEHPVHSYYITQLSDEDRSKLFNGPVQQFTLQKGPNDTVKLETVKETIDRLDPEVAELIGTPGYIRSEARRFELQDAVEDAKDEAGRAYAVVLANALMGGMPAPPAEKMADAVEEKVLSTARAQVRARWRATDHQRLDGTINTTATDFAIQQKHSESFNFNTCETTASPGPVGSVPEKVHTLKFETSKTTLPAPKPASPHESIPDYGSETSADSDHWNSPRFSAGESPYSPDIDSVFSGFIDDADGGVALLPLSLAQELGLNDESNVATPTPASRFIQTSLTTSGGILGAGLHHAFFNGFRGANAVGTPIAVDAAVEATPHVQHNDTVSATPAKAASSPFSPQSKNRNKYPVAQDQPWKGFVCYEVDATFGTDQLVPQYWTTKRDKERYIRHKLDNLKMDDAKLRGDRFFGAVARQPLHIFIDLSNIIIGFYDSMKESRGIPVNKRVLAPAFGFKNFDTILTRDRNVAKRIVAGSMTNSYSKRWPSYMLEAQELQYEMNILERVPKPASPVRKRRTRAGAAEVPTSGADTSGEDCFNGPMKKGEQGVDELLHLKILQSVLDTTDPATMVLATGDAASAQYSDGFKKNVERALNLGWNIELYGWGRNISSAWREPEFAKQWINQFKIIELNQFCEELFDMTIESLGH
ncbi:hypothetical protein N0V88_006176 [Collariella sp. IMI 366227]|nr:hypothetical protein N0V88_006176 [Collariella sp. IMI 366227]